MLSNLEAALELAERGYWVFALNQDGKPYPNCRPCFEHEDAEAYEACTCLNCHGCYAATEDPDRIELMWMEEPDSLIGIRTGRVSGIIVLDFDDHGGGKDGIAELRKMKQSATMLPRTVSAITGGGGFHLYYKYPTGAVDIRNDNRGHLAPGVDIKSDGGFVVAPPSCKRGRRPYSWYPGRSPSKQPLAAPSPTLTSLLPQREPITHYSPESFLVDMSTLVSYDFQQALDRLEFAPAGFRNSYLYSAACRGGEAVAAGVMQLGHVQELLKQYASKCGGLSRNEIRGTTRGGLARGLREYRP